MTIDMIGKPQIKQGMSPETEWAPEKGEIKENAMVLIFFSDLTL